MRFDSQHVQQSPVFFKTLRLIWGPPRLSINWYWDFSPMESVQGVMQTIHLVLNLISSHPHVFETSSLNQRGDNKLIYCQH